jgi:hypothetical protein
MAHIQIFSEQNESVRVHLAAMAVLIETTAGDLVVDLFVKERPRC